MGINSIKKKIGFFPGTFDFCHAGHCLAIEEAKKHCDYLIIGLQTDPSKDRSDKHSPVMSLKERLIILRANKYIDAIVVYNNEKELEELDKWLGDVRFMGIDHYGKNRKGRAEIVYLSRDHGYSSSELRKRTYEYFIQSQEDR